MNRAALAMLAMASAIICAAVAPAAAARPAATPLQRDAIIDIALQLDTATVTSLKASDSGDGPGQLTIGGSMGANEPVPVTIHLKGQRGSKRSIDQKPAFRIRVQDGARVLGRERLTLNNMVQDPTMLHEALGYQVYAAAGVAVPATAYVRLTVNGQLYGLYLLVESIDRQFLRQRFGDDTGILYEGAYGTDLRDGDEWKFELDEGDDPGRARLRQLISAVAAKDDDVFYGPGAQVDTRSFLSMMAVQSLIGDWDNYYTSNNYRIYWSPAAGRWFFIPTGIDQTFGEDETSLFGATGLLFQKCLASERCTRDYVQAIREVTDRFDRLNLAAEMDRLLAAIDDASQADPKKPYDAATMTHARGGLRRFLTTRADVMRSSLDRRTTDRGQR